MTLTMIKVRMGKYPKFYYIILETDCSDDIDNNKGEDGVVPKVLLHYLGD